jgi:TP901 family phage tail tape measure protein
MPTYNVNTAFNGVDKVSPAFIRMGKSAGRFQKRASAAFGRVKKDSLGMGGIIGGNLVAGGITKGLGLLTTGVRSVVTEFVQFDDAITAASAKFKNLTPETLEKLKMTARDVGATTKFSATEAGQGLDFLAMAGFNAQQSMAVLAPTAALATVANVDMARSTDIASDSLGAFGLMTEDSVSLQKNFIAMNDSMAATMTRSNTGIEDMFESIKKGAPAFTAAGQSMNSFNTLVGIMANSGVKGSESGTALRNVMLRLASPTKESQKVLDKLGVTTQDSAGNFRDIVDILGDVEGGLKGMGTAQKTAALATVFGARSVTGVNILLQEGTKSIRAFRKGLDESAGSSKNMAAVMEQSLGNKLLSLKSAAIELGFKFMSAFEGDMKGGIDTVIEAIRNLNVKPIVDGFKRAFDLFVRLLPVIKLIAAAFVIWKVAIIATMLSLKAMALIGMIGQIMRFVRIVFLIAKAKGVWTAAQWLLNVALNANPIGLAVIAILALIAAVVIITKKWNEWGTIIGVVLGPIGMVLLVIGAIANNWENIKKAFTDGGLIAGLKMIGITLLDVVLSPLQAILNLLGKIPGMGFLSKGGDAINKLRADLGINTGEESAPNAAKEEGKRTLQGEGKITVSAEPGSKVTGIDSGIQGVDMSMAGAN